MMLVLGNWGNTRCTFFHTPWLVLGTCAIMRLKRQDLKPTHENHFLNKSLLNATKSGIIISFNRYNTKEVAI